MGKTLLTTALAALCYIGAYAQYVDDPAKNLSVTGVVSNYGNDVAVSKDGTLYSLTALPQPQENGDTHIAPNIQVVDKEGYKQLPEGGKILDSPRNRTYTMVNQLMLTDDDGNCLMVSSDCRNAEPNSNELGYTIYKVDKKGNVLWQKDLADGSVFPSVATLSMIQTTDGGYVFAFSAFDDTNETPMYIYIEKLTKDGEKAWLEPILMKDTKTSYGYPYLVDAGDNQFMLIYARGSSLYLEAQLFDFDGTMMWQDPVSIYNGGFGSTPLQTKVYVMKAPEGAFVAWSDDRSYESVFSNYISYVKKDGTLGFLGTANGMKISYANNYSRQVPRLYYCDADQSLYAIYRQYNQSYQNECGIYMQRISIDGELLWGPEGKAIEPIQTDHAVGYATVQGAGGTDVAVFYQTNAFTGDDTKTYAMRMNADGDNVWKAPLEVCTVTSEKNDLLSSELIDGSYWILTWRDYRNSPNRFDDELFAQIVNVDGTLGGISTAISTPQTVAVDGPADVYSLDGRIVKSVDGKKELNTMPNGVYIVKDKATSTTRKVTIK